MTTHFMSSFKLIQKRKVFPVQAKKAYIWEEEVQLHSFLTLALDGCEWLTSCPGYVPWLPLKRRLGKPQNQSGHFLSLPEFEPKPSSPKQVTIPTLLHQLPPNCQVNTRIQIGQMQLWPVSLTCLLYTL